MDDELLDVLTPAGRPLGVKPRGAVHRDGDWHRAFHLWVVSSDGVLLQRRARTKASWPGCLDASAAGHLTAGERVADGLREAEEELGVAYAFEALVALGEHRVDERTGDGGFNRELQAVFAVRDERPLQRFGAFDRAELDGLVRVSHAGFAALVGDPHARAAATAFDGEEVRTVEIGAGELVPAPYLRLIAPELARIAGVFEH